MKKTFVFIIVAGVYILIALGASLANNAGAVDNVINYLGLKASAEVITEDSTSDDSILEGTTNSNMPIPHPPSPPPKKVKSSEVK